MTSVSFTKFQQAVCSRDVAVHNANYNKNISKCNNLIKIEDTLFLSLSNKYITKFLHSNLINKTYFPVKIIACINYSISRLGKLFYLTKYQSLFQKNLYIHSKRYFFKRGEINEHKTRL